MNLRLAFPWIVAWLLAGAAVADEKPDRISVATWNLEWFFDEHTGDNFSQFAREMSAPSRAEWDWRRDTVAAAVAGMSPTILALQEVEGSRALYYLRHRLEKQHDLKYRDAFVQGKEFFTEQDVALLCQSGLVELGRREQSDEMRASKEYYDVAKHSFCRFEWGEGDEKESLLMANVHFRAMPERASIRKRQARLIHRWVADAIAAGENVIVLGDVNTEVDVQHTSKDDEVGVLRGWETQTEADDLVDLHAHLDPNDRDTHLIGKQFDRILVSRSLIEDDPAKKDLVFKSIARRKDVVIRGKQQDENHWDVFYQIPQRERDVSDHYPLLAEFAFQ